MPAPAASPVEEQSHKRGSNMLGSWADRGHYFHHQPHAGNLAGKYAPFTPHTIDCPHRVTSQRPPRSISLPHNLPRLGTVLHVWTRTWTR